MSARPSGRCLLPSVTRISDLDSEPFEVRRVARPEWRNGQYVVTEIAGRGARPFELELAGGRLGRVVAGDRLVGALGRRAATLQVVGSWEDVEDDLEMDLLAVAGVVGRCTSRSAFANPVAPLRYVGHVSHGDELVTMADFAPRIGAEAMARPTVLVIGTSMDAGKTLAGVQLVRMLGRRGRRTVAAKLSGVARRRDVLAMADAGAEWALDFVDAGLPSTVVPPDEYRAAIGPLLARMNALPADVAVIEAGASPLEPYNGAEAVRLLADAIVMVVLCASDPYAAHGVMDAFDLEPTFTTGRATSTSAGADLTARLTGRPALDLLDPCGTAEVEGLLDAALATAR